MAQYGYTFGAAGERSKVKELDRTVEYTYDALYRLTGEKITAADGTVTEYTYAYDKISNRILKTENGTKTTYTYNALNQLVKENDIVYKYDDAGSLVSTISSGKSTAYSLLTHLFSVLHKSVSALWSIPQHAHPIGTITARLSETLCKRF